MKKLKEGYVNVMFTHPTWGEDLRTEPILLGELPTGEKQLFGVGFGFSWAPITEKEEDEMKDEGFWWDMCEQPELYIPARSQERYDTICKQIGFEAEEK